MDDLDDTEEEVNPRDYTGLAPRFMGSSFDFTGLAEGGRVATLIFNDLVISSLIVGVFESAISSSAS
jgi:hypothetical protein